MNNVYLPHVLGCVKRQDSEFFMNIYFEKEFDTDIDDLRLRLGITKIKK